MTGPTTRISVGITTWNQRDVLGACLNSLFEHPPRSPWEVIVIDNASRDGTAEYVKTRFPQVRLLVNHENRGWAGGCNQAVLQSRGEYVVILNEDTTIEEEVFDRLADALDSAPSVGIAAPQLLWPDGERQPSCRAFPDPVAVLLRGTPLGGTRWGKGRLEKYLRCDIDLSAPSTIDWSIGACLMIKREVFVQVGLFDDRMAYHDDTDFCYRARRAGYLTMFYPAIRVVHHYRRRSAQGVLSAYRRRHVKALLHLFRKHGRLRVITAGQSAGTSYEPIV